MGLQVSLACTPAPTLTHDGKETVGLDFLLYRHYNKAQEAAYVHTYDIVPLYDYNVGGANIYEYDGLSADSAPLLLCHIMTRDVRGCSERTVLRFRICTSRGEGCAD